MLWLRVITILFSQLYTITSLSCCSTLWMEGLGLNITLSMFSKNILIILIKSGHKLNGNGSFMATICFIPSSCLISNRTVYIQLHSMSLFCLSWDHKVASGQTPGDEIWQLPTPFPPSCVLPASLLSEVSHIRRLLLLLKGRREEEWFG